MSRRDHVDGLDEFLVLSAELTGFSAAELRALELGEAYLREVLKHAGSAQYERMSVSFVGTGGDLSKLAGAEHELAVAIAYLWYAGAWPGAEQTAAPGAYAGSLVWQTFGGVPPGSLSAGYGSWAAPPAAAPLRTGGPQ